VTARPLIVGIGRTRYTRTSRTTEHALAAQAINAALADAGIEAAEIDGVVRFDREALWEYDLPGVQGIRALTFYNAVPYHAGSAPALVRMAAMAIATGLANVVVGYHARNSAERPAVVPERVPGAEQFQVPFGVTSRAQEAAILVRRHFRDGHAVAAAIETLTIAALRNARKNPRAIVRQPLTRAAYRQSPYLATPLRRADCAGSSAGAAAFVMRRSARPLGHSGITVRATMQCGLPSSSRQLCEWFTTDRTRALTAAARAMLRTARCRPADIDLVYLWNGLSPLVLLGFEHYGLCRKGQALAFVNDGALPDRRLNPQGGQLGEADLDGINDLVDAVERLRTGTAQLALVAGSPLDPTSAVVLGRSDR
jgi:acetyl-CoA acetyltransferase